MYKLIISPAFERVQFSQIIHVRDDEGNIRRDDDIFNLISVLTVLCLTVWSQQNTTIPLSIEIKVQNIIWSIYIPGIKYTA